MQQMIRLFTDKMKTLPPSPLFFLLSLLPFFISLFTPLVIYLSISLLTPLYADERPDKKISSSPFPNWSYSNYKTYSFRSFAASRRANQRIKLNGSIDFPLLHAAVFYETNRQRVKYGLSIFRHSVTLEKAAKGHSNDMVAYNFFSHTSRVRGKRELIDRIRMAGLTNPAGWAENIANNFAIEYESGRAVYAPSQNGGYFSYKLKGEPILTHTYVGFGKEVVNGWMNSPGHRANILRGQMRYLGCGVQLKFSNKKDEFPRFISTQVFSVRK